MASVFRHTQALCPQCRAKVQARIVERDARVYLEKCCPEHGLSRVLIASDPLWYRDSLKYVKPKQLPLAVNVQTFRGCPDSCGSCPEHQQHTCLPVIEIATDCNLDCPVCLKQPSPHWRMTREQFAGIVDNLIRCEGRVDVLNISGGEPTTHPDLIDFLRIARDRGVVQSTVSTNGLALLTKPALRRGLRETGAIVALQFDGFDPRTWEALRGRDLSQEKMETIRCLEEEGIRYSLVATLVNGVNAGPDNAEIPAILDLFFRSKAVSLMFQPIALTGQGARFGQQARLTIPDVVHAVERCAPVERGDFNPLPCSHVSCFALAYYFILGDGRFLSLKRFMGEERYLDLIANRTLPGLDRSGFESIRNRLYDVWSLADSGSLGERALKRVRQALGEAAVDKLAPSRLMALGVESMKAIFIHELMDVHTFDFGRLIKCCNPYPLTDGRLIPMCARNVFYPGDRHV